MFKVKPYVILVTLVGSLFLVYGMTFLSAKVFPIGEDRSGQLIITLTESIIAFAAFLVLVVSGTFYYMKSRIENHRSE